MDSKKNGVTSVQDVTPYKKSLQVIKGIKLKNISNESNTIATLSYEDLRKKYLVNLDGPEETDPIALEVLGKNGPRVLGMYGGITLITAKAKSGKTFASSLFISALVKGQELSKTLKPSYLENRRTVIFFDTEQREGSIKKLGRRIWALAETQNNFEAFKLRAEQNNVRADIIEQIIYNSPGLAAIVIDGVRDLIYDINNSQEAASVSSRILKWAEDLNILIIVILHQNKNDNNARGHFGTELKNKAEVIVNISKDKETGLFLIEPEDCREAEFDPIAFKLDERGFPQIQNSWIQKHGDLNKKTSLNPNNIPDKQHYEILNEVFKVSTYLKYNDLLTQIILAFADYGISYGRNKAVDFAGYYLKKGLIKKGMFKEVSRYSVYFLTT